jgi:hypothetical protein
VKYEIRSIGIWAFVKQSFFVNLVLGFVVGLFYAMFMGTFLSVLENSPLSDAYGAGFARIPLIMLMVMLPILMAFGAAFFNTIFGLIAIVTYNFVTRFTGGLEMVLEPIGDSQDTRSGAASAVPGSPGIPAPPPPYAVPSATPVPYPPAEPRRNDPPPASKYE